MNAQDVVKEWRKHWSDYYDLSGDADCASPDRNRAHPDGRSEGCALLESVRDSVFELVDNVNPSTSREIDDIDDDGSVSEIADAAPDVYTHTRWVEFVDLAAYNEDVTELGADTSDLTATAGVALYMIANRLAWAMLHDLGGRLDDMDDDESDDDQADE